MESVIYAILNKINNKRYVGSAKDFKVRKRIHLNQLKQNKHHSYILQKAWNKYGNNNFEFIILEEVLDSRFLIKREQWWIDNSNCEYNISKIANSSLGIKRRYETIEKCRIAHLGEKHPDWRNKLKSKSQGGDNHWTKKKKFSIESRKKMSDSHNILYKSGYIHPQLGTKLSIERIEKMRIQFSKPVIQKSKLDIFIKEWPSIKQAAKYLNISECGIVNCCKKKINYNTAAGYKWEYKTINI